MNIIEAMHDSRLFLPVFKDVRTWRSWETYLRALFGLGIDNPDDLKLFQEATGLTEPPKERAREAFAICGRRSGKSFTSAIVACYLACFQNWKQILSAGERGMVFILSVDKYQSRIIRDYISTILNSSESFKKLIKRETPEEIELRNQVTIAVKACSFRAVRGFQLLAVLCDEVSFWRDENSSNPADEILRAVRPGLLTSNGLLLAISTPYSRAGVLYQAYKDYFGKASGPLIWKSPSIVMNPTLNQETIRKELEADSEGGRSEWLAEFRSDISSFISHELVESATIPGRHSLPWLKGIQYHAFADPSGGRQDSFTLGIAHRNAEGRTVLDVLLERKPPFSPESVVEEYADVLKAYGLSVVCGDAYAASWCSDTWRKCDVFYEPSQSSASELYLGLLPLLSSGRVELLDQRGLKSQLSNLERRIRAGGRDLICHGPGLRDDCANAAAGSLVLASLELQRDGLPEFVHPEYAKEEGQDEIDPEIQDWLLDKKPKKEKKPGEFDEKEWDVDNMSQADIEKELGDDGKSKGGAGGISG